MSVLLYPLLFLQFWWLDIPKLLYSEYKKINQYLLELFSIPLLLKTFTRPLKNEYREGLVVFSVIAGIIVKSILLAITLTIMLIVLFLEALVTILIVFSPIIILIIL